MSFESGAVSVRFYHLPRPFPDDVLDRFAEHAAPSLEYVKDAPVFGWVTGRHLLDRDINESTARYGSYLRVCLLKAERKIPSTLLKAEMRQEEFVRLQMNGQAFLSRKDRQEIRDEIMARLLPSMPPQLKGTAVIHEPGANWLYADATPAKASDELVIHTRHATGIAPLPLTAEHAAMELHRIDPRGFMPVSFSPEVDAGRVVDHLGYDFLTWLWYASEAGEHPLEVPGLGKLQAVVQGPLKFVMEGGGAHETTLRKGNPPVSSEARACLLAGKKLASCKLGLAMGETAWEGTFDAEEFTTRTLKLPTSEEKLDPVSLFQFRMIQLAQYRDMIYGLLGIFLQVRRDDARWKAECARAREWVKNRQAIY